MRKVVLYTLMSLDGDVDHPGQYFASSPGPGRPPEFDSVMIDNEAKVIGAQDAVLLGRRMYDEWSRYWPTADEQPFADFINGVKKYVVTSTPLWNEWHNAEAVKGPIEDLVRDLKARPGGDIGVHGSSSWRSRCSRPDSSTNYSWLSVRRLDSPGDGCLRAPTTSAALRC